MPALAVSYLCSHPSIGSLLNNCNLIVTFAKTLNTATISFVGAEAAAISPNTMIATNAGVMIAYMILVVRKPSPAFRPAAL